MSGRDTEGGLVREQSLARVLAILRGRWRLMVVIGLPIVLLSLWFAATRAPEDSSQVVVSFTPESTVFPDTSFTRLVPRYLLVATDAETLRSAETMAGLPEGSLTGAV